MNGFEPEIFGIVPPSGTRLYRIDQAILDRLLGGYRSEIVYLCRACANDVLYPMWFKYFRSGPGGAGEAYHLGVFGKTGSGRSGLAKMMLCAYAPPTVGHPRDGSPRRILLELSGHASVIKGCNSIRWCVARGEVGDIRPCLLWLAGEIAYPLARTKALR